VHAFARVLFHVQPRDADALDAGRRGDVDEAVLGERLVELRDLIALGEIGIEVIFAGEDRAFADLAMEGERGQRGEFDCAPIQDGQRARQAEADRTDVGIGRRSEAVGAAAEGLGLGEELDVDFEPDDGLVFGADFGRKGHSSSHGKVQFNKRC
jgi:hypothetical protein